MVVGCLGFKDSLYGWLEGQQSSELSLGLGVVAKQLVEINRGALPGNTQRIYVKTMQ